MSQQSQIIYTVVVRNKNVILSEYAVASGNYVQFVQTVISKVQGQHAKRSFSFDKYGFHILTEENYQFLIMTDQNFKLRIAYACLDDLKNCFYKDFSQTQRENSIAYALQNDFTKTQRYKVEYYNSPESDKITQVKQNLDYTKNIMMENLDKLLERGEKLDILVQKTEQMTTISSDMKKHATQIRRDMWWRNKKIMILLCLLMIVIIYVIMLMSCGGFKMDKCF